MEDLQRAIQVLRALPEPTVDAFYVHSEQEFTALREHVDFYQATVNHFGVPTFGIPLYVHESTPPGVLRATLRGEVVEDVPIR